MLPWILFAAATAGGLAMAFLVGRSRKSLFAAEANQNRALQENSLLEFKLQSACAERDELQKKASQAQQEWVGLQRENARMLEQIEHLKVQVIATQTETDRVREQLRLEFENLNRKFFAESTENLNKLSKESFVTLVKPFDQELQNLKARIHEVYDKESRERLSLEKHIEHMMKANHQMSLEAQSLTKALRGDAKAQGNWGEVVLERILESSGLREGQEFIVQGRGLGLRADDGSTRKPDVLIHLPGGRHIVIDSKVSLSAYEAYIHSDDETVRPTLLKDFIISVRRHVDELSAKNYQSLYGINSPDFVLMFMPTDGAFSLAHQSDPQLFSVAMEKKIAIVSPSLLFPNLRTIETMWRQERQSKNAEEIARQAGGLYDKFVLLIEDLDQVQIQLSRTESTLADAFLKLKTGKGNLIDRVEKLRLLGAKAKKQLPGAASEEISSEA